MRQTRNAYIYKIYFLFFIIILWNLLYTRISECLDRNYVASGVCVLLLCFFFFHTFLAFRDKFYSCTVHTLFTYCSNIVHMTYTTLFKNNIKNRSYGTIYTFKNYFIIVFSVFNFNKNKLYPNETLKSQHSNTYFVE